MTGPVLLSLGYGYSARWLAASLPEHWCVIGTTRSSAKAAEMRASGIRPVDWADPGAVAAAIAAADHVLISMPPDAEGDPALARHRADLLAARPRWIGYLSTTGVYGDRAGGWVDETDPLRPINARSIWRMAAEQAWSEIGLPVTLFRLAGIYGPGRSAFDRLRAGTAQRVVKPGQVFSRIHVEDIALALRAAMDLPSRGQIYNLADDEPAPPQDVIAFAANLLSLPVPPAIAFEEAELSPMARSFYANSKRVSNARAKRELGWQPRYPTYRDGLRAILTYETPAAS